MENKYPFTKLIICTLLLLVVLYFLYRNFFLLEGLYLLHLIIEHYLLNHGMIFAF